MTQEEKQLLLQDLCARLPYGVICEVEFKDSEGWKQMDMILSGVFENECYFTTESGSTYSREYKPYLRPLSSMTEDEFKELKNDTGLNYDQLELVSWPDGSATLEFYLEEVPQYCVINVFNWLNKKHFDYNGLITMGLALPLN